jgi:hypothetical protein
VSGCRAGAIPHRIQSNLSRAASAEEYGGGGRHGPGAAGRGDPKAGTPPLATAFLSSLQHASPGQDAAEIVAFSKALVLANATSVQGLLDPSHVLVGEAEVVADLVDEDMAHNVLQSATLDMPIP